MKILVITSLLQILTVSSASESSWTVLVGEDGTLEIVNSTSTPEESNSTLAELREDVLFYLYTNENADGDQLYLEDDDLLDSSSFNSSNPTRIVIHGWRSSASGKVCTSLYTAYLAAGDYNVIVVDWSAYTKKNYLHACTKIATVGRYVASMIDYLAGRGMDPGSLTILGHSLGAHVAGVASRNSQGTGKTLIGLDPAGPLFYHNGAVRMKRSDASFVQVVHTSSGWLGHKWDLGDSNIWVNGGSKQPGCGLDVFRTCAHSRAYYYCAESISNPESKFVARQCESYSDYTKGYCATNSSTTLCGVNVDTSGIGRYFVTTNSESPYAMD